MSDRWTPRTRGDREWRSPPGTGCWVLTPAEGIPARSGTSLSAALCDVYRIVTSTPDATSGTLTATGTEEPVWNGMTDEVEGSIYVFATRDDFGRLTVVAQPCEPE